MSFLGFVQHRVARCFAALLVGATLLATTSVGLAQNAGAGLYGLRYLGIEDDRVTNLVDGSAANRSPLNLDRSLPDANPELIIALRDELAARQVELGPYAAELSELTLTLGEQLLAAAG